MLVLENWLIKIKRKSEETRTESYNMDNNT